MPTTEATIATDTATWVEQQPAESAESFGPTVSDHVVARFVLSKTPAESANDEEAEIAASMAAADAEAEAQRGEDSDVADMDGHKGKGNHKGVKGDPYSHEFVKIMGEVFGIMKLAKDNRGKWSFGSAFDYDKAESILCDLSEKAREENDVVRERDIDSVFERLESRDRAVREGLEHYIRAYKRKWYAKRKNQRR